LPAGQDRGDDQQCTARRQGHEHPGPAGYDGDREPADDLSRVLGLGEQRMHRGPDRTGGAGVDPEGAEGPGQRQRTRGQQYGETATERVRGERQAHDADRRDPAGQHVAPPDDVRTAQPGPHEPQGSDPR
jgi:hypothetical protein